MAGWRAATGRRRLDGTKLGVLPPNPRLDPEADHLPEGTQDHVRPVARRAAGLARQGGDRQLLEAEAAVPRFDQQLGAEGRAAALDVDVVEHLAPEELERAVDVARDVAEQERHEHLPAEGEDEPLRR